MEISQTKMWFVKKVASLVIAIMCIISTISSTVIAEEYTDVKIATKKAELLREVALAKAKIVTVKKEDLVKKEMPIYTDMSSENIAIWGNKVKGTDKWNAMIEKISEEEGVDPVFVKCIMAIESSGNQTVVNTRNKNGTSDYGLMQVNTHWGNRFDYRRMKEDPEYAIRSGIKVIKYKISDAQRRGMEPTAFEVLWRYNGKSAQGKQYAMKVVQLYEDLSKRTRNDSVLKM